MRLTALFYIKFPNSLPESIGFRAEAEAFASVVPPSGFFPTGIAVPSGCHKVSLPSTLMPGTRPRSGSNRTVPWSFAKASV